MNKDEKRDRRRRFRKAEAELRAILNEWDPIGCQPPEDEYDCLNHHILSALQHGGSIMDVKVTISEQLRDHFGLSGIPESEINTTTNAIWAWWAQQAGS